VFGIEEVTQFNNHFSSRLRENHKFFIEKINVTTLNHSTIEIDFANSILLKKEHIDITIKFI